MIGKREMQKITMTEKESIDISIHCLGVQAEQEVCEECPVYHEDGLACREAARVAIKALEEIQQYREIGTVEECRKAREKQKPKKARFYSWSLYCPDCGQLVGNRRFKWENNFCRNCGRPIDWSEEE